MFQEVLKKVFGTKHDREMKKIRPVVDKINSFEAEMKALSDDALKAKTPYFRERLAKGETLDDLLPEAFAVCREASHRVLGMRHYDVQMIGGIVLHRGSIAEMRTGEGKTLVATLAVYLNGLSSLGVHVVTVNDYLVRRDSEWMSRLYNWLGLTTGIIVHGLTEEQRKASYGADITYATNNELGFDYLRDNMKLRLKDLVQRPHNFAIIDECDSILIDEARTPLIISGQAEASTDKYYEINKVIPQLKIETHFTMEEKNKSMALTEEGNAAVEKILGIDNLYDPQHIELMHHVYQGLKAHHLYRRDVEYMISNGEIVIVDEFTGRLMPGRRWSDGLHQAIEAKEGVEVKNENQTLATITFQNYFKMYKKLSGMTGTADTESVEFKKIYNLDVSVIPTNKPIRRADHDDIVFKTEQAKFKAITEDIKVRYQNHQPVLVGTVSIEKSETLSKYLSKEGIKHEVLNAKHHEREAEIVAQAGRKGRITIATNMAGRGTDIMLGGNPEVLARREVAAEEAPEYPAALDKYKKQCDEERKEVVAAGGLYIVGTERHESRRIDNQLRGRSGRQGDPGESRFYLSLEDNLMRIFNGERIQKIMTMLNIPEDEPITAKMVTRAIEGSQRKVEGHHFDARKNVLDYDNVMNQQRNAIYGLRRQVLDGADIERIALDMLGDVTSILLDTHVAEDQRPMDWNLEALNTELMKQFGFQLDFEALPKTAEAINEAVSKRVKENYDKQASGLGVMFKEVQQWIILNSIDHYWKEHLKVVDKIKEGIYLRAHAQKDPLIEYKKEAFVAFENLNTIIKTDSIEKMLKVQLVQRDPQAIREELMPESQDLDDLNYSGGEEPTQDFTAPAGAMRNPNLASISGDEEPAAVGAAPKRRMSYSNEPADDGKLNREQRRRMNKEKRR